MKPTEKQIEEIAEELDCGMKCFYHLETGEIKNIPNNEEFMDEELWEDVINEIEENEDDYVVFEGPPSFKSFKIMEDFAEQLDDNKLQDKLIAALNKRKPFSNFKWEIDNSGEYRQKWFDFKKMRFIEWVKEQIELEEERFSE